MEEKASKYEVKMKSFGEFEDEAVGCVFAPLFGLASALLALSWIFGGNNLIKNLLEHSHEHKSCLILLGSIFVFSLFSIFFMHIIARWRVDEACDKYRSQFDQLRKELEKERNEQKRLDAQSLQAQRMDLNKQAKSLENQYKQKEKDLNVSFQNRVDAENKAFSEAMGQLQTDRKQMEDELNEKTASLCRERDAFDRLLRSNRIVSGSAKLYAEWKTFEFDEARRSLVNKPRPALVAAEEVRRLKAKAKQAYEQCRTMEYKFEILLSQFPELATYVDDEKSLSDALAYENMGTLVDDYDRRRDWLSKEEYLSMSDDERSQLSLDRYVQSKNKSDWQIGRDYELYCGYLYRKEGWKVEQQGITKKLKDLGRDIIAEKGFDIHVVQCKLWSQKKQIHENVICQLFGTTKMYEMEFTTFFADIKPVFMTNISLSEEAEKFARHLGVIVRVEPMGDFPRIKCNISSATHEKIYHLPFDQQYDRTKIDQPGEFYAWTIEEAVSKGFRRAKKFMDK